MEWLRSVVGDALVGVLTELLLAALTLAAAYAVLYLRRLSARLQEQAKNELADAAIRRVENLAVKSVLAAEGTVARELRAKVAAGQLSSEALRDIGRDVVREIMSTLDVESRQALQAQVGDIRAYIQREVEAQLEALKAQGVIPRMETLRAAEVASVPK